MSRLRRCRSVFGLLLVLIFSRAALAQIPLRTINVPHDQSLTTAISGAKAGDLILLSDGNYAGFTITKSGTFANPIFIRAVNNGNAVFNSGTIRLSKVSYVSLDGIKVTTPGTKQTIDSTSREVAVWLEAAKNCRVTRSWFALTGQASAMQWIFLSGASSTNEIDHCDFGPNTVGTGSHYIFPCGAVTIPGVTPPEDRTAWANGASPFNPNMSRNTLIDHNNFHDVASGVGEAIVLGGIGETGDYQYTQSIVQSNIFQNCNGDAEVVSVKSSGNTIAYNTMITCGGVFSLRAGNKSVIVGNFILQGATGAGGIKLYEQDHIVYNNYISGGTDYPILVGGGDPYEPASGFAHAQVLRAKIIHNTVVNNGRVVQIGHSGTLFPTDCVFANNIMYKTTSGSPFTENEVPVNMTYSNNFVWPSGPSGKTTAQFKVIDPKFTTVNNILKLSSTSPAINAANNTFYPFVTFDIDGQIRDSLHDIGCDEVSSTPITTLPLTPTDVGPGKAVIIAPTRPPTRGPVSPM